MSELHFTQHTNDWLGRPPKKGRGTWRPNHGTEKFRKDGAQILRKKTRTEYLQARIAGATGGLQSVKKRGPEKKSSTDGEMSWSLWTIWPAGTTEKRWAVIKVGVSNDWSKNRTEALRDAARSVFAATIERSAVLLADVWKIGFLKFSESIFDVSGAQKHQNVSEMNCKLHFSPSNCLKNKKIHFRMKKHPDLSKNLIFQTSKNSLRA